MKKILFMLVAFCAMTFQSAAAPTDGKNTKTTSFSVAGHCQNCKARIEKAALAVAGVKTADWNVETKQMKLVYEPAKTTPRKVMKAIAAIGYDAGTMKAKAPEKCSKPKGKKDCGKDCDAKDGKQKKADAVSGATIQK